MYINVHYTPVAVIAAFATYSGGCAYGEVQLLSFYLDVLVLVGRELIFFITAPMVL